MLANLYNTKLFYKLILISLLFLIGNLVFVTDMKLILKIVISEFAFILLYTLIDKGNFLYGYKFTILMVLILLQYLFPFYQPIFYSIKVQYFSIIVSCIGVIVNGMVINKFKYLGLEKLLVSRISTTIASFVEITIFAILLHTGLIGMIYTIFLRVIYIYIIPKYVFILYNRY